MATTVTLNGATYDIPAVSEDNWGNEVSSYLIALSTGVLTKAGGTFTLTADTDFGSSFGLKAAYYKSRGTVSTTGIVRLANTESIAWRNAANSADIALKINASNILEVGGNPVFTLALGTADQVLKMNSGATAYEFGKLADANIAAAAAIAVNKLAAVTSSKALVSDGSGFVSASSVTSTELGYVSGVTSALQTQLDAKEPTITTLSIAKGGTNSGTTLNNNRVMKSSSGTIIEAAAITAARALISDANGIPTHSAVTSTELGYVAGVTSALQTQIDGKQAVTLTTKGDILTYGSAVARLGVGADGTVLTADAASTNGIKWSSTLVNPMTTAGDIIVGGVAGAATRLAIGASGTVLKGGTTPSYASIVNADISASAAIDFSKLATLTSANILVGSAGNVATSVAMTGDITITSAGVTAIGASKIVNSQVSASAAIAGTKISPAFGTQNISTTGTLAAAATTITTATGVVGMTVISGTTGVETLAQFKNSTPSLVGQIFTDGTTVTYAGAGNNGIRVDSSGNVSSGVKYDNSVGTDTQTGAFTNSTTTVAFIARNTNSSSGTLAVATLRKDVTASASAGTLVFLRCESASGTSNGIIANANATTLQFSTPSDLRLKTDIVPVTGALDKVMALNPVEFTIHGDRQRGFIAQELHTVLPEFVTTTDDGISELSNPDDAWSITSPGYVTYLVAAIQELKAEFDAYKAAHP